MKVLPTLLVRKFDTIFTAPSTVFNQLFEDPDFKPDTELLVHRVTGKAVFRMLWSCTVTESYNTETLAHLVHAGILSIYTNPRLGLYLSMPTPQCLSKSLLNAVTVSDSITSSAAPVTKVLQSRQNPGQSR